MTPCCGKPPFELPRTDRMTLHKSLVTCRPTPPEPPIPVRRSWNADGTPHVCTYQCAGNYCEAPPLDSATLTLPREVIEQAVAALEQQQALGFALSHHEIGIGHRFKGDGLKHGCKGCVAEAALRAALDALRAAGKNNP